MVIDTLNTDTIPITDSTVRLSDCLPLTTHMFSNRRQQMLKTNRSEEEMQLNVKFARTRHAPLSLLSFCTTVLHPLHVLHFEFRPFSMIFYHLSSSSYLITLPLTVSLRLMPSHAVPSAHQSLQYAGKGLQNALPGSRQ